MPTRTRSLASRIAASLTSADRAECSQILKQQNDLPSVEEPTALLSNCNRKRLESITSHLRKYSIANDEYSNDDRQSHSSITQQHQFIESNKNSTSDDTDTDSGNSRQKTPNSGNIETVALNDPSNASTLAVNDRSYYAYDGTDEQLNEYTNSTDVLSSSLVIGPGGVTIPQMAQLRNLVPSGTIEIICLTWNVASKSESNLNRIAQLLSESHPADRTDLICLSFQELPPTNAKYHEEALKQLNEALCESHSIYCWVRKWSQLVIVYIRKSMILFASAPEWQFISSSTIVKPMRTKGAIAIYFRLFQTSILLIACHLSHGSLINRINDYSKICEQLIFPAVQRFGLPACQNVRQADCVFWFGDLNFRLKSRTRVDALSNQEMNGTNNYMERFFSDLLIDDELTIEKCKGTIFAEFDEPRIGFPPTHKFIVGSNDYVYNRIPSYTDRVLFYSKDENRIRSLLYDSLWDEDSSDHKPVYAVFTLRVTDHKH